MTLPYLGAWSPGLPGTWAAVVPVLLALAVSGLGALLVRRRWAAWAGLPGALGVLAGWAALLLPVLAWRGALRPRTPLEHLVVPAVAVAVLALAGPRLRGRLGWWAPVLVMGFVAWWLAGYPAAGPQFWRVWAAGALAGWVAVRVVDGQAVRAWSAGLAAWGGLAATGAPRSVTLPALVLAAAWTVPALAGTRSRLPPALTLAMLLMAAGLALGRLPEGGVNGADLACLLALAAPVLGGLLQRRVGRGMKRFGPAPAMLVGAAVAGGAAWAGAAMLGR